MSMRIHIDISMHTYLSKRIHFEELRRFVGNRYFEIGKFQLDTTVLCCDESLVNIFVSFGCVQDLHMNIEHCIQVYGKLLK